MLWAGMTGIVVCRQRGQSPPEQQLLFLGWFSTAHSYVCSEESGRIVNLWGFSRALAKGFFKPFHSVPMRAR